MCILNISGCHQNIEHNLKHLLILGLPKLSIADDTSSSVKPFCSKLSVFSITPNSASAFPCKKIPFQFITFDIKFQNQQSQHTSNISKIQNSHWVPKKSYQLTIIARNISIIINRRSGNVCQQKEKQKKNSECLSLYDTSHNLQVLR